MRKTPKCVTCHAAATFAEIALRPMVVMKRDGSILSGEEQVVTYWCAQHSSTQ